MSINTVNSTIGQLYETLFKAIDADQSGGVSPAEFTSVSSDATDRNAAELLPVIDKNLDGVLTQVELKTAFGKLSTSVQNELLNLKTASPSAATFSLLTALYDSVSADAAETAVVSTGAPPPPAAAAASGGAGATNNDPADLNHDGVVTKQERRTYALMSYATTASSTSTQQAAQSTVTWD